MPYLTPQRFRTMGFGSDVSSLEDGELAALIAQASTTVDAYCNVSRIPQKHDFRGGVITQEEHAWRYPTNPFEIGQRRYYPWHWPVVSIEQFRIYVTNTQYVEIAPTELMINNSERYFEVVSLAITSSGLFNALIVPNVGLATPVARCSYTYGWGFTESGETLVPTDGQTFRAQNQFWKSDPAPVVMKNGTVVTTGFSIDYIEGTVIFDDQLPASDSVTASYDFKLPTEIQYGTGHIVAYLVAQSGIRAKGLSGYSRLRIAEIEITRPTMSTTSTLISNLDTVIPEAAMYLTGFRNDQITIR